MMHRCSSPLSLLLRCSVQRRSSSSVTSRFCRKLDYSCFAKQQRQFSSTLIHKQQSQNKVPKTLQTVAEWVQESENTCQQNILVLCGAGVSVAAGKSLIYNNNCWCWCCCQPSFSFFLIIILHLSQTTGIPDFRTPGTGLYDNLQKYNLPFPEAVFDLNYFQQSPQAFLSLARDIWPGIHHPNNNKEHHSVFPTLTHSFLAMLQERNVLLRCYTQNIDGLEFIAGVSPNRLVECHGHFRTASCTHCGEPANVELVKECIVGEKPEPPLCAQCHTGYVKVRTEKGNIICTLLPCTLDLYCWLKRLDHYLFVARYCIFRRNVTGSGSWMLGRWFGGGWSVAHIGYLASGGTCRYDTR